MRKLQLYFFFFFYQKNNNNKKLAIDTHSHGDRPSITSMRGVSQGRAYNANPK